MRNDDAVVLHPELINHSDGAVGASGLSTKMPNGRSTWKEEEREPLSSQYGL